MGNGLRLTRPTTVATGVGAALLDLSCDSRVQIEPSSGMVISLTFNDINPINMGPSQTSPTFSLFKCFRPKQKNLVTKQLLELDFGFFISGSLPFLLPYIYNFHMIRLLSVLFQTTLGTTRREMKSVLIIILLVISQLCVN